MDGSQRIDKLDMMNTDKKTSRFLGAAFLLQAIASFISGLILFQPLIVPGNISESLSNISDNPMQLLGSIVGEMFTAIGVIMLGVLMYAILKRINRDIALIGMGLYIVEAAILVISRIPTFALLKISEESVANVYPSSLQTLANLCYETQEFGYTIHMLFFGLGATLFYYLFLKSGYLPKFLSIWGIIAAPLAFIGTLIVLFGMRYPSPFSYQTFPLS
ncbi:MAG: DUF4386 domain-containing protein [Candidatus Stygibacter frigidus]|nr:DUF4386 domain-containing protein [Candidatus Stygibacter frigidus]